MGEQIKDQKVKAKPVNGNLFELGQKMAVKVSYSKEGLILDLLDQTGKADGLHRRIVVRPKDIKGLLSILAQGLLDYEQRYGKINNDEAILEEELEMLEQEEKILSVD